MPSRLDRDRLIELLTRHATPGDEAQVGAVLVREWLRAGWRPRGLGAHAVLAEAPAHRDPQAPLLLVCAHMDAPGFAIHACPPATAPARGARRRAPHWALTPLGGPGLGGGTTPGWLKCAGGVMDVVIGGGHAEGGDADDAEDACPPIFCRLRPSDTANPLAQTVRPGDRVCFAAEPRLRGNCITSPFLDNRLGCWLVAELPRLARDWTSPYRLVVAATGGEEFTGHGAAVLAHHLRPDLTIVLDATYVNAEQGVRLGGGPVLTLSDRSVLIPPARRDALLDRFARAGLPLQTEVYNTSGTDAGAFPRQGVFTPVLPLLIPTTGNHSAAETADLRDAATLLQGIRMLAETTAQPAGGPSPMVEYSRK